MSTNYDRYIEGVGSRDDRHRRRTEEDDQSALEAEDCEMQAAEHPADFDLGDER